MLSLQMQLIKNEAFGTVSVCQCDGGSDYKALAQLATLDLHKQELQVLLTACRLLIRCVVWVLYDNNNTHNSWCWS